MKDTFNTLTAKKIVIEERSNGEITLSFSPEVVVVFSTRESFYDLVDYMEEILPRREVDQTDKYVGHTVGKYDKF
jgi:hypothetical protein